MFRKPDLDNDYETRKAALVYAAVILGFAAFLALAPMLIVGAVG